MHIESTLNLHRTIANKILRASSESGINHSTIIVMIMRELMRMNHDHTNSNRGVKYQERLKGGDWHQIHIKILIRDYEYFLDMRKFCKWSVSAMIAFAVEKYLDKIIYKYKKNINNSISYDNNQFSHYILIKSIIDNVICWKIYWGYTEQLIQLKSRN